METMNWAAIESDARHDRMDRVAVLYGEITAATREFLRALAESDRHRDWVEEGLGSCAEWLAWRIGITKGTANEKVRAARALEYLPLISEAMASGELSFSKVRALTRAAVPENEAELLEFACYAFDFVKAGLYDVVKGVVAEELGDPTLDAPHPFVQGREGAQKYALAPSIPALEYAKHVSALTGE